MQSEACSCQNAAELHEGLVLFNEKQSYARSPSAQRFSFATCHLPPKAVATAHRVLSLLLPLVPRNGMLEPSTGRVKGLLCLWKKGRLFPHRDGIWLQGWALSAGTGETKAERGSQLVADAHVMTLQTDLVLKTRRQVRALVTWEVGHVEHLMFNFQGAK